MKTTVNELRQQTIQEFAEEHDLEMVVNEIEVAYPHNYWGSRRFSAGFAGCYAILADGEGLPASGRRDPICGGGISHESAIQNYADKLSCQKRFVIQRNGDPASETRVPRLIGPLEMR